MIPKIIHYCWFGGKEMPALLQLCIASWKKYLPDYQIKRWDETNFDFNMAPLCKEAYAAKKWAFVADYCRIYALYTEGGIYMDTDILVLKNFDEFLKYSFCTSEEYQPWVFEPVKERYVDKNGKRKDEQEYVLGLGLQCGVMMAKKGTPYLKDCMDFYNTLHLPKKNLMDIVVGQTMSKHLEKYGFRYTTQNQHLSNNMYIAAPTVFSNMTNLTKDSYAWHLYFRSWGGNFNIKQILRNKFPKIYTILQLISHKKFGLIYKVASL